MLIARTISLHIGTSVHRGHNVRAYKEGQTPAHIDQARSASNRTLVDVPLRQAYADLFGEVVAAYNDRQSRDDRKITDYLAQVKKSDKVNPVYEAIVQVGNMETSSTDGDTSVERAILMEWAEGWAERNPQMRLVGLYYHADEQGAPHLHVDFVPYGEDYKRGLSRQVSFTRAAEQQGFIGKDFKETPQALWTAHEREVLEAIAHRHGVEVIHVNDGRKHEADKAVFIAERQAQAAQEAVRRLEGQRDKLTLETYRQERRLKGQHRAQEADNESPSIQQQADQELTDTILGMIAEVEQEESEEAQEYER